MESGSEKIFYLEKGKIEKPSLMLGREGLILTQSIPFMFDGQFQIWTGTALEVYNLEVYKNEQEINEEEFEESTKSFVENICELFNINKLSELDGLEAYSVTEGKNEPIIGIANLNYEVYTMDHWRKKFISKYKNSDVIKIIKKQIIVNSNERLKKIMD